MRSIIIAALCLLCIPSARAARPLFQAELDVTNAVEVTAGVAYQISGRVTDRSVMGYDGLSVAAGDLVFSETITGDVDAWQVTNVVASNAVHVTLDVVYQPAGETNLTLEFPAGPAALCTVSETATTGYPQPPSETGAALSAHMLNEIRNYSFRLVPSVGSAQDVELGELVTNVMDNVSFISNAAPFGATIAAGAADGVTRSGTNLVITWNTNAAGGGSGAASAWYTYPARELVTFAPLAASNYFGAATYNQDAYKGETGTIDWTDPDKALVQDDDPAVLALEAGQVGKLLVTTNYTLTGGTGAFVRAVTVYSRYEGDVSGNADGLILLRYGALTWADAEVVGQHIPPGSFDTYADTHTFASPISRNDLADMEVGFWLTNGAAGATGRVDALLVTLVGAEPWEVGPEADGDFGLAFGGGAKMSVTTNGAATFAGDVTGAGASLVGVSNLALLASNAAALNTANLSVVSNIALTASNAAALNTANLSVVSNIAVTGSNLAALVKEQFDGSSSQWFKADGSVQATGSITSSYPIAGRQPGWQMRVTNPRLLTNNTTTLIGFDTIVSSNQTTFSTTAFSATPLVPGVYLVTATAWIYGVSVEAGREGRLQIRKAGSIVGRGSCFSMSTASRHYFPTATALEYFDGTQACDVNFLSEFGNGLTNGAEAGMKFTGVLVGTGW